MNEIGTQDKEISSTSDESNNTSSQVIKMISKSNHNKNIDNNWDIINDTDNNTNDNDKSSTDELRCSIRAFVSFIESAKTKVYLITYLSKHFGIKRRRFYDIINVLESVGCCRKNALDSIEWYGLKNILGTITQIKEERMVYSKEKTLGDLFPIPCVVGITNLTTCFISLFFALNVNKVDLRFASQFLSRETTRYKTTLCKLYQITYILCAIDVMDRTNQVCEIVLKEPFYSQKIASKEEDFKNSPFSVSFLLNRNDSEEITYNDLDFFEKRRNDFQKYSV